ncbi:MAG: DNA repair protein RadC [Candidatus Thiodiazotropha sp.]
MNDQETIERALAILEQRLHQPDCIITKPEDASAYLKLKFGGLEHESFRVMFLDNQHRLIKLTELFRGTIDGAAVYPREVVKAVMHFNAAAVILAHNHPSGVSEPSQADKRITKRLSDALSLIDVRVLDHIVVGGNDAYSFAQHNLL